MPGLKERIFSDSPAAFWSFDEDRAGLEGNQIIDEINNANPLVINGSKYLLEQLSLNDLEVADQYSIRIANDGYSDTDWSDYNTFFECVNSTAFSFPQRGSFSIEFLYYKERPGNIRDTGEVGYNQNIFSPIIQKGTMIDCRILDYMLSSPGDRLYVGMFNGSRSVTVIHDTDYPVFGRINHVVITYGVIQTDINEYESNLKVYVNGRLWGTSTETHVDSYPNTSTGDSWLIAGNGGADPRYDFNTELLILDQMAIYPYELTNTQVSDHYRKTKHYDVLVKDDYPAKYYRFDEENNPLDYTLYADVGGIDGLYQGQVVRHLDGPEKLVESYSANFQLDSTAYVTSYGTHGEANALININQPYTAELWFKSTEQNRGVLFSSYEENSPWDGLNIWLNSKNNVLSPGNVQISENKDNYVNSVDLNPITGERNNWNNGVWHYLVVRRTADGYLQLWLDGNLDNQGLFAQSNNGKPSQLHFMGTGPVELNVNGQISEFAFYNYAFQDIQIYHRWLFTTRYKVSGYTLLQGNPIQATVRFYDHISGNLLQETNTDSITGEYNYYPATNRYVDVLAFIPDNKTTRYRVHGPVKPAEFDDSHLIT